jgi:hypothetical protein
MSNDRKAKFARRKNGVVVHTEERVTTEAVPRPTRRGSNNYKWPLPHRAVIFAAGTEWDGKRSMFTWPKVLRVLKANRLDIVEQYESKMKKPLTAHVISQRYDKALRQKKEYTRIAHLVPEAINEIKTWNWSIS